MCASTAALLMPLLLCFQWPPGAVSCTSWSIRDMHKAWELTLDTSDGYFDLKKQTHNVYSSPCMHTCILMKCVGLRRNVKIKYMLVPLWTIDEKMSQEISLQSNTIPKVLTEKYNLSRLPVLIIWAIISRNLACFLSLSDSNFLKTMMLGNKAPLFANYTLITASFHLRGTLVISRSIIKHA